MLNDIVTTDEVFLEIVLDGGAVLAVGALEGFLPSVSAQVAGQVRSQEESLWAEGALVAGSEGMASQCWSPHRRVPSTALKTRTLILGLKSPKHVHLAILVHSFVKILKE